MKGWANLSLQCRDSVEPPSCARFADTFRRWATDTMRRHDDSR